MQRGKSCKITNMIRVNGSERRPFIFVSRLNIVQRDSYETDEIVMAIGSKMSPTIMSKAFEEFY